MGYTDMAVRHVMGRQGVIGICVKIFLPHDPKGQLGPKIPLDDVVTIVEPKEEIDPAALLAAQEAQAAAALAAAQQLADAEAAAAQMAADPAYAGAPQVA